jgi:hypothetical protein
MTNEFKQKAAAYLEAIEMPEAFSKKAEKIYEFYRETIPEEIISIFVSDYLNEDGERQYENLWFFSETHCMEAKQFITKDDFDITPFKVKMKYIRIQKENYDFKKATEKSKLYMSFGSTTGMVGDFKASKENCDYLKEIILQHFIPNLVK